MIPDKILKFLEEQANVAIAGTRDRNLVPYGHRVCAWRVHPDRRTLTAFVGAPYAQRFLESMQDNGQIALTIEEFPLHETYQVKGRYLGHRPLEPADVEAVDETRERMAMSIRNLSPDYETHSNLLRASIPPASVAVDMAIDEVFVQTPGPNAGRRVYPPSQES